MNRVFRVSLFQSKNEPEGSRRGWPRKGSFQGLDLKKSLAVVGAVGMWESRSDFQAGCETRRVLHRPSFPQPSLSRAEFFSAAGRPQLLEESAFGLLHALGGFGVADWLRRCVVSGEGESGAQVLCRLRQGQQRLQRGLIAAVEAAFAAFVVDLDLGLGAGPMVVQIGIEVRGVELVDGLGVGGMRYSPSPCVCGSRRHSWFPPGRCRCCAAAGFWFARSAACSAGSATVWIDELAAVIGMKAEDAERKLPQDGVQHRFQPGFADACGGGHDLPLRDFIDRVDVIHAFGPRLIALMHGVHAQIAGLALRIGPPPFADAPRRWAGS